jgi:ferredoxin/flavodoxin---NADP+ reductase
MATIQDTRVIHAEAEQYNAALVRREDETEDLAYFSVRFTGKSVPFEPGQYLTLGVYADGQLYQRPYSVASSARRTDGGYEFYVRQVPILRFTTLLFRLPLGHGMRMTGPKGRFLLEKHDDRRHVFVSTGTGIAPFISMVRTIMDDGETRRIVMVHGVSYQQELGYGKLLGEWTRDQPLPFTYIPTVSRRQAPENAGWTGRWGRVEDVLDDVCADCKVDPTDTVVYICGNPEMILNVEKRVQEHGLPEPHVKRELYWPKGKTPPERPAPNVKAPIEVAEPTGTGRA